MNVIIITLKENIANLNNANLLFTDTIYEIKTNDLYEDFHKYKDLFDFSGYPKDSKFFDPVNSNLGWLFRGTFSDRG